MPGRRYALLLLDMVLMVMYQRLAASTSRSVSQETDEMMDLFLKGLSRKEQTSGKTSL